MALISVFSKQITFKGLLNKTLWFSTEKILILVCLISAFLIRLLLIPQDSVITPDGFYYIRLGGKIISGDIYGGISAYWSSLYPFLIGITSIFFHDSEFAGIFVSLIAGTLLVIPVYLLIRKFYGRRAAYIGIIIVLIQPYLIRSSMWVLTESLYTLIFTTIIITGWYALRKGKKNIFLFTGLLLGAAFLVKPEAIGFVGLFFVLTMGVKFFRPEFTIKKLLLNYLFLLLGFGILFLPFVGFLHQKTGRWMISQKFQANVSYTETNVTSLELTEDGETTGKDQILKDIYETKQHTQSLTPNDSQEIKKDTADSARLNGNADRVFRFLKREVTELIPGLFPLFSLFVLIATIGFFYKPWSRLRMAKELYLISIIASTILGYAVSVIELRYLIPIIPILIAWIAKGIVSLGNWIKKSAFRIFKVKYKFTASIIQFFTLILITFLFVISIPQQLLYESAENFNLKEKRAGLWIKNQTQSQLIIMSSNPIAAFYANAEHIYLPNEKFSVVLDYARRKKVSYLIYNEGSFRKTPQAFPTDQQILPEGIKLVHIIEQDKDDKIFIYQLLN